MAITTHELFDGHASLPLAEDLEVTYSTALVRSFDSKRSANGKLISAWNHIEFGLNSSLNISTEIRGSYLSSAQDLLTMIHKKPDAHQDTHLEAMVLSTYIPLFRKRAMNQEVLGDDCVSVYVSLGRTLAYLKPFHTDAVPPTNTLETVTLALSARMRQPDMLLFPTSPREEASSLQPVNHDSYFMRLGTKLPVQQKLIYTDKNYAESITMLTLMPLVDKAYKKHWRDDTMQASDKLNAIIAIVIAEAHGEQLNSWEKGCLDYLSRGIAGHYHQAAARISPT